jgi:alpha-L-rhamnosidase
MTSFNHYAYGAIGEWLYSTVAGIDLDTRVPGYKRIVFRPQPGPGITRASGRLETRYGLVACRWEVRGGRMNVDVTVPPNTTGTVCLPGRKPCTVRAGSHRFCCSAA